MDNRRSTVALLHGCAVFAAFAGAAFASVHQDHMVSGGGRSSQTPHQVTWAALGEPLGGRMSGGGFVIQGGGGPPPGNGAPSILSFIPADRSRFYRQDRVTLSVSAADPDGDPLEYRFLLDGAALQDWSTLATVSWDTASAPFGWHTLRAEVRDPTHTASRESRGFLFHRPPSP